MVNNWKILLLFLASLRVLQADAPWYDQKLEGWYYFEEKAEKPPLNAHEAECILELEKVVLKKMLSLALLDPTTENVESYISAQKQVLDQSSNFAATWGKVLLEKPFLGDFLANPTSNYGILAKREFDLKKKKALMQKLSKEYFLLVFFRGKEYSSEKAAEVASLFGSTNGWKVKAISLDGIGTPGLTDFEVDKGLSVNMGVQVTPSMFIVNPKENKAFPVGAGLISVNEIEQNIENQLKGEEIDD